MVIMSSQRKKKRKDVSFSNDTDDSNEDEEATIAAISRDTIPKRFGMDDPSSLRTLDIPSFTLPLNDDRYELWTVRLPTAVNLNDMHSVSFRLTSDDPDGEAILPRNTFQTNGGSKYAFQLGHAVENESFRLLLPALSDEDNDKLMVTAPSTFQKHVNVVLVPPSIHDDEAPSMPLEQAQRRRAYAPVPQKTGLKRRWLPFGAAPPTGLTQTTVSRLTPVAPVVNGVVHIKMKDEYDEVNGHAARTPHDVSSPAIKIKEEYVHGEEPRNRQSKKAKKAEKKALKKERKHKRIKEEEE
jgi:DNA-directed RNA polymerase I subunit RPA34.5